MTEFNSPTVSEYLVGIGLVETDKSKLNKSAMIIRLSLMEEWWGKNSSKILSRMLKSSVMMRKFWMFTSEFLRYFKVEWKESE